MRHADKAAGVRQWAINAATVSLLISMAAMTANAIAAPVGVQCTFEKNIAGGARTWTVDLEARTVDGHPVDAQVPTVGAAYNRYFITPTEIGFATSNGVRHTISRVDGRYTAFGANGKIRWAGKCAPIP